jgi:acetyl esterase/lipase
MGVAAGVALAVSAAGCNWPAGTRYVHQVFDEVEVTSDITYRTTTKYDGTPIDLKLDIYEPVGDTATKRPVIMFMFGGGFVSGDKTHMSIFANDAAKRGYVAVSIQYRIRPTFQVQAVWDAYEDSLAATQWLIDHAGDYDLDPEAVVVAGYSAGAYNALHVLDFPAESPAAGGISMAGNSIGGPTAGDPPLIMFHGTADTTVSYTEAVARCDEGNSVGAKCEFVSYEGEDHLFGYDPQIFPDVVARYSKWVFENVLWPLGYRPE